MKPMRNFSIIAHIDHGKTTLTDRMLLKTGTIGEREFVERLMDSNPIEQERGITIKMAPVRMHLATPDWEEADEVVLNLIDTPGHVDFSYEVSRSLAAVEGALLLVDATQGVQAQTLSHFEKAREHGLVMIPVINKVDLPNAEIDHTMLEMMELFEFAEDEFVLVSAKTGEGVDELMRQIVKRIPAPQQERGEPLRALVFSSHYNTHKGVVVWVRVMEGELTLHEAVELMATEAAFDVEEIGYLTPKPVSQDRLLAGEVGYVATGLKEIELARVGDTITTADSGVTALPGYRQPQLMVYMDFYPLEGDEFTALFDAMEKLNLHDAALEYSPTHSQALGNGLRVGFLGVLHAEIVRERLSREFDLELIATAPSVRYRVVKTDGEKLTVTNPAELPEPNEIEVIEEPIAEVEIYTPEEYIGSVIALCEEHRGEQQDMVYFGKRVKLKYLLPLSELILTFYDQLKSISSGFASLEYEVSDYASVDAVKLSILVNKEPVEALSQIVVREKAEQVGRRMVEKLKEVIPRQLFAIPLQAAVGGNIVARETIKAFRKDVTAKLYGGDRTRRMKLLEQQKKGKERRAQHGSVEIPQEAFFAVLKRD